VRDEEAQPEFEPVVGDAPVNSWFEAGARQRVARGYEGQGLFGVLVVGDRVLGGGA